MTKYILLILGTLASAFELNAVTLHLEMTPELAGTNGFMMKRIDAQCTRFAIPFTPSKQVMGDSRYPVVRAGELKVYGDEGLLMRCRVEPRKTADGQLVFRFELADASAKRAVFTLTESRLDGQVGGGKVFSYRLLDFIDPGHQQREMLRELERAQANMLQELKEIRIELKSK